MTPPQRPARPSFTRQAAQDVHDIARTDRALATMALHLAIELHEGEMQVVEVLAVGPREQDVAYLMAGLRLGRITDPYRKSVAERIVHRALSRFRRDT